MGLQLGARNTLQSTSSVTRRRDHRHCSRSHIAAPYVYMRTTYAVLGTLALAACSSASDPAVSTPIDPGEGQTATGGGASLSGRRPFPDDNPWNTVVSGAAVDPASSTLIGACGLRNLHPDFGTTYGGAPNGIPYIVVHAGQARVPLTFDYASESDPG